MGLSSTIHTGLFAFAGFWSLLVWTVTAGFRAKIADNTRGINYYNNPYTNSVNAILAWGLISMFYFIAHVVVLLFVSSANIFVSVIFDVAALAFLWLFGIVSVGILSQWGGIFADYSGTSAGSLGSAVLGLGWILVLTQMGLLAWETISTLIHHGASFGPWRSSFHDLNEGGSSARFGGGSGITSEPKTATAQAPLSV
ncbi:hypothetical protein Q8F55_000184 [Vanrija albida]|uniref:MARVEL domain-containing protein n=1 Tax=Vanrija albida TaxID=181172 RepID=A0ABR3QCJ1_9TREE